MDSSIIRPNRPQISRKPAKPVPLDAADAATLEAWLIEVQELVRALHETGLDATARDRVHSRKELRRRLSKLMKRLYGLIDAARPLRTPPAPPVAPVASDAPPEKLRLVSVP